MTPGPSRVTGALAAKTRQREPDGAAGGDFVWPPPVDDPATCSVVVLEADEPRPRVRTTLPADVPMEWFPDIDVETALDAFADPPAAPTGFAAAPAAALATPPPTPWWRAVRLRGAVALGIGASLALVPPAGLPSLAAARPLQAAHTLDVSVGTAPPSAPRGRARTPDVVRPATTSIAETGPGRTVPRDEDRIRTTLAELGAAYSQLDAVAAREVWPSMDVDALARAFDGLQSQELRFDHCDVTVDGPRARADCTGQAIYVPRSGAAGFSRAPSAWSFELTRLRGRWMIASGRAS
jgi:hypothetical protein